MVNRNHLCWFAACQLLVSFHTESVMVAAFPRSNRGRVSESRLASPSMRRDILASLEDLISSMDLEEAMREEGERQTPKSTEEIMPVETWQKSESQKLEDDIDTSTPGNSNKSNEPDLVDLMVLVNAAQKSTEQNRAVEPPPQRSYEPAIPRPKARKAVSTFMRG